MIVRGEVDALIALSAPITLEFTTSKTSGTHLLRIQNELDGPISDFGDRLLNAIEKQLGKPLFAKQDEVIKVSYSDRYLNSPLPVTLFLNFIHEVREQYKDNWRECALDLTTDATCPPPSPFSPQKYMDKLARGQRAQSNHSQSLRIWWLDASHEYIE